MAFRAALVILLLVFGTVVAGLVPIVLALVSIVVALALGAGATVVAPALPEDEAYLHERGRTMVMAAATPENLGRLARLLADGTLRVPIQPVRARRWPAGQHAEEQPSPRQLSRPSLAATAATTRAAAGSSHARPASRSTRR